MYVKDKIIDHVGILTIQREEALNALNPDVLKELNSMLIKLISNHNVDSIIITGAGEKAFIAGADIKLMQSFDKKQARDFGELGQNLTLEIENSPKPVLAAVNGFALGGGCEIAISCHIRYASENAFFAQPEVKLGIIPGWGGTQRLPRIVGKGNATELIIGGHMINSQEALRIGLVNKIISPEKLMDESINFCKELQKNGPTSISNSLKCINDSYDYSLKDGLETELEAFSNSFGSKEADEGLLAFVDKRKPKFKL